MPNIFYFFAIDRRVRAQSGMPPPQRYESAALPGTALRSVPVEGRDDALGDPGRRGDIAFRSYRQGAQHDNGDAPIRVVTHDGGETLHTTGMSEEGSDRREGQSVFGPVRSGRIHRGEAVDPLLLEVRVEQFAVDQCLGKGSEILGRGDGVARGPRPRGVQVRVVVRFQGSGPRGRDLVVGE